MNNVIDHIQSGYFVDFIRLKVINLEGNQLLQVNRYMMAGLFTLENLNLAGNGISDIPCDTFTDCTALKTLNLRVNRLTALPCVVSNPETWSLQELNLANNSLMGSHDPLIAAHLRNVTFLDLSCNVHLTSLGNLTTEMPYLASLGLQGTSSLQFGADDFRNSWNLHTLVCNNSGLQYMPLLGEAKVGIEFLDFYDNKIKCVDVDHISRMDSVTVINFTMNRLTGFPDVGCSNHANLDNISDINFPNLEIIRLTSNYLTEFPRLSGIPAESSISVSYNYINNFPPAHMALLTSVESLYMTDNSATIVPDFSLGSNYQMKYLGMGYNRISSVPVRHLKPLTSLKMINLEHNNMTEMPDLKFLRRTLDILIINSNFIGNLTPMIHPGSQKWKLTKLDISFNRITEVPGALLRQLNSLTYLNLTNNNITDMPIVSEIGPALQYLYLEYNDLVSIPHNTLVGLDNLRFIQLRHNYIHSFPFELLSDASLPSLRIVELDNNELVHLPNLDSYLIKKILMVNVTSNRFNCTYEICWLKTFNRFSLKRDDALCANPPDFVGKSFSTISSVDLGCYCKYQVEFDI